MAQNNSTLSQQQLAELREMLLAKRNELVEDLDSLGREIEQEKNPDTIGGGLSTVPTHPADAGSDEFSKELLTDKIVRQRRRLTEVDDALARLDGGTYGICLGTGEPIEMKRLRAQPWAKYSLAYEKQMEAR